MVDHCIGGTSGGMLLGVVFGMVLGVVFGVVFGGANKTTHLFQKPFYGIRP